jgi:broad specificity phosphatase PhoE
VLEPGPTDATAPTAPTDAPTATDAPGAGPGAILLVRHGQSTWNAVGRWQGQADPPLTSHGIGQAERAAGVLGPVAAVWASDLERAAHTARILAAPRGLSVTTDPRMRERAAGPWTGLTREEIDAQYPGYLDDGRRPPGYEDDDAIAARAFAALREFAATLAGGTGVVVSHGGVILTVERRHGIARTPIHNLEARWLTVDPHSPTGFAPGARVTLL